MTLMLVSLKCDTDMDGNVDFLNIFLCQALRIFF